MSAYMHVSYTAWLISYFCNYLIFNTIGYARGVLLGWINVALTIHNKLLVSVGLDGPTGMTRVNGFITLNHFNIMKVCLRCRYIPKYDKQHMDIFTCLFFLHCEYQVGQRELKSQSVNEITESMNSLLHYLYKVPY